MTHTPKKYWFKRRRYGYGWTPVTWQGWVTVFAYLLIVLWGAVTLPQAPSGVLTAKAAMYIAAVVVGAILLIIISHKKGPAPKWRWGKSAQDNPDEDF